MATGKSTMTAEAEYAEPDPQEEPEPTPQASGDPGACGETPCWSRTAVVVTEVHTGRAYTFSTDFTGTVLWSVGEETPQRKRGSWGHTFAAAGSFEVHAVPIASSCAGPGMLAVTVV